MENDEFDVVIVGAGTAGVAAAYAFAMHGSVHSVALIEREDTLGGNAVNDLVYDWIQGVNPLYFESICTQMGMENTCMIRRAVNRDCLVPYQNPEDTKYTWIARRFYGDDVTNTDDGHIFFDPNALSPKYKSDLSGKVSFYMGYVFDRAISVSEGTENDASKRVHSIVIKRGKDEITLTAQFFIDCSADGVLCRSVNNVEDEDYYVGLDRREQYQEDLLIENDPSFELYRYDALIAPSMFFNVTDENGKNVSLDYLKNVSDGGEVCLDGYLFPYVNNPHLQTCNPMSGLGISGKEAFEQLSDCVKLKKLFADRIPKYYCAMKNSINPSQKWAQNHFIVSDGYAKTPGIRETYRLSCKRMLNQNDLMKNVFDSIAEDDYSDYIAMGSHGIDLHNTIGIDANKLADFNNTKLQPYGIPYGCI